MKRAEFPGRGRPRDTGFQQQVLPRLPADRGAGGRRRPAVQFLKWAVPQRSLLGLTRRALPGPSLSLLSLLSSFHFSSFLFPFFLRIFFSFARSSFPCIYTPLFCVSPPALSSAPPLPPPLSASSSSRIFFNFAFSPFPCIYTFFLVLLDLLHAFFSVLPCFCSLSNSCPSSFSFICSCIFVKFTCFSFPCIYTLLSSIPISPPAFVSVPPSPSLPFSFFSFVCIYFSFTFYFPCTSTFPSLPVSPPAPSSAISSFLSPPFPLSRCFFSLH